MDKNKQRRAACRVWQQVGRIDAVIEALEPLKDKLTTPDDLLLETCINNLIETSDEMSVLGSDIYPEVERKKHN